MKQGLEGDTGQCCNFDMIGSRLLTKIDLAAILRANKDGMQVFQDSEELNIEEVCPSRRATCPPWKICSSN